MWFYRTFPRVRPNCWAFVGEFEGDEGEFFYYLKATVIERYFFIRTNIRDRGEFIEVAKTFGRNLDFEVLQKKVTNELLRRIKLISFE